MAANNKNWIGGAATQAQVDTATIVVDGTPADNTFTITMTDEKGQAAFAWREKDDKKSVTLKLGETDIGELLAVLNNEKPEAGQTGGKFPGIYHQNQNGSTTFSFKKAEGKGYYIRLAKKPNGGELTEVKHTLSFGEAQILKVLLERAVIERYQW